MVRASAERKYRLTRAARFRVLHQDETRYGSAVTDRVDETLREACPEIVAAWRERGTPFIVKNARALLDRAASGSLGALFSGAAPLPDDFLHPPESRVHANALSIEHADGRASVVALPAHLLPELAQLTGDLQRGMSAPQSAAARAFFDSLFDAGALEPVVQIAPREQRPIATLIGHASVLLDDGETRIQIDPFLLPDGGPIHGLRPIAHEDLGEPDAIFVTHSHPDHFDLGSLLRFGAHVPIFVPEVERESVLTVDMALRLEELGFKCVRRLRAGDEVTIRRIKARALPFYGEQPAVDEVLHPEVRSVGLTYAFDVAEKRVAIIADSGRDPAGDIKRLAREDAAKHGALDVLFAGYRGFALYPIHFLFSSVGRFLPFVPRHAQCVRQKIMNDADDALDVAEIWGAKVLIPYADGGAPWYWEAGLGPRLDGARAPIAAVDPAPDDVLVARSARSGSSSDGLVASPVMVHLLRPGDGVALDDRLSPVRSCSWPFGRLELHPDQPAASGETFAVLRKKILLRLLSREAAERSGVEVTASEIDEALVTFRQKFGLQSAADTRSFLADAGVTLEDLREFLRDGVLTTKLEEANRGRIDALMSEQIGISTVRLRALGIFAG